MVLQNAFRMEFSHQIVNPEYFADSRNIPQHPPTIRYPDRTAIAPHVSPLLPCVLLSQQSHLFPICVVSTYNDFRRDLHKLCRIPRNCQCKWLLVAYSAPRTFGSFCFARTRLDPLGGQILHYDCISMIVSRFTTFTENFVICCNQITKIFCTRYGSASASCARALVILVLWQISPFRSLGKLV